MVTLQQEDPTPRVLCEVRKSRDVTMVVRLISVQGLKYVDVRDWLETKQAWGRGYWFDATKENMTEVAASLLDAAEDLDD